MRISDWSSDVCSSDLHGTKCVIGTTGFDEQGKQAIQAAGQKIAVVFAPNMSVGVNATLKLLDMAAKLLNSGYDVEVFEAHHRNKEIGRASCGERVCQ